MPFLLDDISGSDKNNMDVFASKSESPSNQIYQGQRALSLPLEGYKEFVYLLRVIKGGSFSKLGSRLSAAHIRFENAQQFQGWRAVPFQNGALA